MKEKNWNDVTRLPEEDLALISSAPPEPAVNRLHSLVFLAMSATILTMYLVMNYSFFPGYPVMTGRAENNTVFAEHYPPFRMNEWTNYSITEDIIKSRFSDTASLSRKNPFGFSLVSVPLTLAWGKAGPYFTNVFILWLSALLFFFLALDLVSFPVAVGTTLVLALATPNLFYASSAFAEPLGQLFIILALFLFHKGLNAARDWLFFLCCGAASGLNLFVQPVLAFAVIPFAVVLVMEGGRGVWRDRNIVYLAGGFALAFLPYILYGIMRAETPFPFFLSLPWSPYNVLSHAVPGIEPHIVSGIWSIFLNNPHGLISLIPILLLAPAGFIVMWRNGNVILAGTTGAIVMLAILHAAGNMFPITGECLGPRQVLPILPLLILPLAFLWDEGTGERIWLAALLTLTVYMSGLGWWAGAGNDLESPGGSLQDRAARFILLARKDQLDRPRFKTGEEVIERFTEGLKSRNIRTWLETLSPESRAEITGIERDVFKSLVRMGTGAGGSVAEYIRSADPVTGIQLIIPPLSTENPPAESPAKQTAP